MSGQLVVLHTYWITKRGRVNVRAKTKLTPNYTTGQSISLTPFSPQEVGLRGWVGIGARDQTPADKQQTTQTKTRTPHKHATTKDDKHRRRCQRHSAPSVTTQEYNKSTFAAAAIYKGGRSCTCTSAPRWVRPLSLSAQCSYCAAQ